mmetsp:Transcript_45255/g.50739  ORF Transcript_45255/g.50739 Transcript_45255/m.50739 type:complete len:111 (-) Transcript_45255:1914-2246(-)
MENSNNTLIYPKKSSIITEMVSIIPKEFEMPVMVLVFAFFAIVVALVFSKFSSAKEVQQPLTKESHTSPVKSSPTNSTVTTNGTPIEKKTGTIMTPAGRRSARLVRRKED